MNQHKKLVLISLQYRGKCHWALVTGYVMGKETVVPEATVNNLMKKANMAPGSTYTLG